MDLRRDQLTRIARAPAKLNLFLEILGRRADGFHELETLMLPIGLFDSLSFTRRPPLADGRPGQITLEVRECFPLRSLASQPSLIPNDRSNLVVRALELLRDRSGCEHGADVQLVKRIPAAAGLGGGSSDAATALRLANTSWELDWSEARLAEVAAEIGSDVAFFLSNGAAICRGRGERVERVLGMRRMDFVIVKPSEGLSTAEVYRAYDAKADVEQPKMLPEPGGLGRGLRIGQRFEAACWMHNRLQAAAAAIFPWVDRLQSVFSRLDVLGHQLSGSGSAYFGICRSAQHARRLAALLRTQQLGLVFATRSIA
jgi:4-diphosphocytidyl-2-C-methyl-D-erythritol kinase